MMRFLEFIGSQQGPSLVESPKKKPEKKKPSKTSMHVQKKRPKSSTYVIMKPHSVTDGGETLYELMEPPSLP